MRDSILYCLSRLLIVILLVTGANTAYSQVNGSSRWTWIEGENKPNAPGVYGTKGVAAAANKPGARNAAGRWKDAAGNLWLFGGFGIDGTGASGYLNDLWKFTVSTGLWTWMGGEKTVTQTNGVFGTKDVLAATNWPGSRDSRSLSWTDENGNFWLFGGYKMIGSAAQVLNDLWRFEPSTSRWAWVTGSQSGGAAAVYGQKGQPSKDYTPGGKHSSVGWADGKGNLWLYGGVGTVDAYHNDLWQFHIPSRQWSWEGGDHGVRSIPVYGIKGFAGANNNPGGRYAGTSWADSRGDLWMYGGYAVYSTGQSGQVGDDLWHYDVSRKQWIWESGDPLPNVPAFYGILNTGILANNPGNRLNSAGWSDANDNFFLYGGLDHDGRRYGDLWRYNTITHFWTWISGDNGFDQAPVYTSKRAFLTTSQPGSRSKVNNWVDNNGNLILFGGSARIGGSDVQLNDLWQFGAEVECVAPTGTITPNVVDTCAGSTVLLHATTGFTYQWFRNDVAIAGATDSLYNATTSGTYKVRLIAGTECDSLTKDSAVITINPPITVTASHTEVSCAGVNSGSITATGGGGTAPYQYRINGGALQPTGSFPNLAAGLYTVTVVSANNCTKDTSITVGTAPNTVTVTASHTDVTCASTTSGTITATGGGGTAPYQYRINGGALQPTGSFPNLAAGTYTLTVLSANNCTKDTSITVGTAPNTVTVTATHTDVTCASTTSGTITATGGGGTAPYQYRLNGGTLQPTGSFPNLAAGTYTLTVLSANNCTKDTSITIGTAANTVGVTASHVDVTCAAINSGSITATGNGGSGPYQYRLGAGAFQASGSFPNLTAGTYVISIRDANTCQKDTSITVGTAPNTVTVTATHVDVSCAGVNSGSITATGGGGTAPYQYRINGGALQPTGSFPNLAAGLYTVTVLSANNCTKDTSITVGTAPNTVTVTATHTDVTCASTTSGTITATGGGGTAPYQYRINGGALQPTGSFPNLAAGTYTLTVLSANNCTKDTSITIGTAANTVGVSASHTDVTCAAINSGSITATGNGGSGPYQYRLGAGAFQASGSFPNLTAGTYVISIRDANTCQKDTSITIGTAPNTVTVTATHTDVTCASTTSGSITATGGGGTAPYQYRINGGALQPTGSFPNLAAGLYTVTVVSANNCTKDTSITVGTAPNTVTVTASHTDVTCASTTSGTITATGGGGTAPYQYRLNGGTLQPTGSFPNLAAGTYTLTVLSANNCTKDTSITIGTAANTVGVTASHVDVTCAAINSGSITATGNGGSGPYQYRLGAGAFQASGSFPNLTAGTYVISIRDANTCQKDTSITVGTAPNTVTVTASHVDVSCAGVNSGSITATGGGGTAPYQYRINGGALQPTGSFPNLVAGAYTVTVVSANNCTKDTSITVGTAPNTVTVTATHTDVTCASTTSGTITATGGGGIAPYQYRLNGGTLQPTGSFPNLAAGTYTLTVLSANNCTKDTSITIGTAANTVGVTASHVDVTCAAINSGSITATGNGGSGPYQYRLGAGAFQASGSFPNLTAGTYVISIRDANTCQKDTSITVGTAPNTVTVTATHVDVSCAGVNSGSITATGGGGTAPYQYRLNGGALQPTGSFPNLPAGLYTVTVLSANNCTKDTSITIGTAANTVGVTASHVDVTCVGINSGSITATGNGGSGPYQYRLGAGAFQASGSFPNLTAGTYVISIRDANTCQKDTSITVGTAPNTVTVTATHTDVTCASTTSGTITATGGGGTAPYQYRLNGGTLQPTGSFPNLAAGTYTLTVLSANNCTKDTSITIGTAANTVGVTASHVDVTCAGINSGSITATGNGGSGPYQYRLGAGAFQASGSFPNLTAGTYVISVRDANTCQKDTSITIGTAPNTVTVTATHTNVTCASTTSGTITATGGGGTAPYQYRLNGGTLQPTGSFPNLAAGTYTLTVLSANNCTKDTSITIGTAANTVGVTATHVDVTCAGINSGSITATGNGGSGPYQYRLGAGAFQASGSFPNLTAGTYVISIRDANTCQKDTSITVGTAPNTVTVTATHTNVTCASTTSGSITATGGGGTAPYQYRINGGALQPTGSFPNLAAGTYTLTVLSANNCTKDTSITIGTAANTVGVTASHVDVTCAGINSGSITATGNGGSGPYQYRLGAGAFQASGSFPNLTAGTYVISIRDANTCQKDTSITVGTAPNTVTVTATHTNVTCASTTSGSITATGGGGTAPYQYRINGGALQPTGSFPNLAAGTYTLTVLSANNCTKDTSITIGTAANTVGVTASHVDVTCAGINSGSITATGNGGSGPYQYRLGAGAFQASGSFPNLTAGTYVISVRDANTCQKDTSITIGTAPNTVTVTATHTNVTCASTTSGSITATGGGGTAPYQYRINGGALQPTGSFPNLAAGLYTVTVVSANNCTKDTSITISATPNTVTATIGSKTDIPCIGGTGSITVVGSGGTAPYQYRLGNGAFQVSADFTSLAAGNYTVSVRDAVGCISPNVAVTISQTPNTLLASLGSKVDIPCSGGTGSATIAASGGTQPYSYRLGAGGLQASPTFGNLPAGDYVITVQDVNGCTRDVNFSIIATQNNVLPIVNSKTDIPCVGGSGALSVSGSGGTAPYQYRLNGGAPQPTGVFTNLVAGSYVVSVSDANGCSSDIAIIIAQSVSTVTAAIGSKADIPCAGGFGSVTIQAGGGSAPYQYKIGAGAYQASATFANLPAGDYVATVRDNSGCTADISFSIIQTINTVTANVIETDIPCSGGTGTITVTGGGGVPPYQYRLGAAAFQASGVFPGLAAGSYTVSVRDAAGCIRDRSVVIAQLQSTVTISLVSKTDIPCSGGNIGAATVAAAGGTAPYTYRVGTGAFQANGTFANLPAGNNTFTVRDANGCTNTLVVNIGQLNNTVSAIIVARRDVPCSGGSSGSVTLAGTGGTAPYQYRLGNAAFGPLGIFIGLSAGSYTFTVRDAVGCSKDTLITIQQSNNTVTANLGTKTDIGCLGGNTGSVTVIGGGGTAPYLYKIGSGAYGPSPTFSGLAAGNYIVTVQDAEGCTRDLTVSIVQLPNLVNAVVSAQANIPCSGGNVGSVTISSTGGAAPYVYKLDNGAFVGTSTFSGLAAGEHIITVRDATGCSTTVPVTILQSANTVTATIVKNDIPCSGGAGSIVATGAGGTAPYEYKIGSAAYQPSGSFPALPAGSYPISIKDAGGCTKDTLIVIRATLNTIVPSIASQTNIGCASGNIGAVTVAATGGTAPYEYKIGTGTYGSSPTFGSLPAGNHIITIRDAVGCTRDQIVNITQTPNTATINITNKINVTCAGGNTGSFIVVGGGGSAPYTYKVGNSAYQTSGAFNNLGAGSYVVTVRNALGCTKDTTFEITQAPNTIVASVGSKADVPCSGGSVGSVTITASGGAAPLSYKIGTGNYVLTSTFIGLAAGDYIVTVKDANNCTKEVPVKIEQLDNTVTIKVASKTEVPCSAGDVGSITVEAGGGTAPYTYKIGTGAYQPSPVFNNLAPGPYTITVKDDKGCIKDITDTVKQKDNTVTATVAEKTDIPCSGGNGSVTITGGGGTAPYMYKLGANPYVSTATFPITTGGEYTVTVKDAAGCTKDVKFNIASPGGTPGTISPATVDPICSGTSQLLTATDGASYQWYRNDTLITGATSKTYPATTAGKYTVRIGNGTCLIQASNTVTINVNSCTETVVFVAKAFTPNNNNTNDKLGPKFINVKQFRYFKVYNRWGQLVYETSTVGEGWDGTFKGVRQPMETYSWILEAVDNNGKTIRSSGKSILIR